MYLPFVYPNAIDNATASSSGLKAKSVFVIVPSTIFADVTELSAGTDVAPPIICLTTIAAPFAGALVNVSVKLLVV